MGQRLEEYPRAAAGQLGREDSIASHGDERRVLSTGIIATTRVSSTSYYRRQWSVVNNNNTKLSETHILKTDIWSKDNSPPQAVVFQKLQYNKVESKKTVTH